MRKNKGFTLVEMMVAVAILAIVVTVASTIFVLAIQAQRQSLAYQELLDQTSYVIEYMSRAIRMAIKDDIESGGVTRNCLNGQKVNYEFTNQCLRFRNYKNECQEFCLVDTGGGRKKLVESIDGGGGQIDLTSPDLNVNSFTITLTGETQDDYLQPLVFIFLNIEGKEQTKIQIQTSISQRNLDIQK